MPVQIIRRRDNNAQRNQLLLGALTAQMDQNRKQAVHEVDLQGKLLSQSKLEVDKGLAEIELMKESQLLRELFENKDIRRQKLFTDVAKTQADIESTRGKERRSRELQPNELASSFLSVQRQLQELRLTDNEESRKHFDWQSKVQSNQREMAIGLMESYRSAPKEHRAFIRGTLNQVAPGNPALSRVVGYFDRVAAAGGLSDPVDLDRALKRGQIRGLDIENRESDLRTRGMRAVIGSLKPSEIADVYKTGLLETILPRVSAKNIENLLSQKTSDPSDPTLQVDVFGPEERKALNDLMLKLVRGLAQQDVKQSSNTGGSRPSLESLLRGGK